MTGLHMASEMREQPSVLAALSARRGEIAESVRAVRPDRLHGTVLVARGSSDHAAIYGRYLLEPATGRPVALAAPSLPRSTTRRSTTAAFSPWRSASPGARPRSPRCSSGWPRPARARSPSPTSSTARWRRGRRRGRAARRDRAGRSGHQDVHRPGARVRDPGRGTRPRALRRGRLGAAARGARDRARRPAAGRRRRRRHRRRARPDHRRARLLLSDGARGRAQAQGDRRAARRGLLLRRPPARSDGGRLRRLPRARHEHLGAGGERPRRPAGHAPRARRGRSRDRRPSRRGAADPRRAREPLAAIVAVVRAQQVALALARQRGLEPDTPRGLSKVTLTV